MYIYLSCFCVNNMIFSSNFILEDRLKDRMKQLIGLQLNWHGFGLPNLLDILLD